MVKKIATIFLVSVMVLIGAKFYPKVIESVGFSNKISYANDGQGVQKQAQEKQVKHRNKFVEPTFPFKRDAYEELAKKYPDQFNIVKKMYYSWDYIHNAQGEFVWGHPTEGSMEHVIFYVDFDKKENRMISEQLENGKVIETENVLVKGPEAIREFPAKHIFNKEFVNDNHWKGDKDLFEVHYMGLFNRMMTNSEWWTLIYNDYTNWTYKEGKKFGMPVYQIKGTIPTSRSESLAGPFTMTVSKETGMLLDLKCYGHTKNVIQEVTAKSIQVNKGVQDGKFQLDVSGDKPVSNLKFNLSGVGNVTPHKSGWDK